MNQLEDTHFNLCHLIIQTITTFGENVVDSFADTTDEKTNNNNNSETIDEKTNFRQKICKTTQFIKHLNDGKFIKRTKSADELKQIVNSRFNNDQWNVSMEEMYNNYLNSITNFLQENDENIIDPLIKFGGKQNVFKLQSQVLYKYKNHEGKTGIKTRISIPKNTVIGQYIGAEYKYQEFLRTMNDPINLQNGYAFILNVDCKSDININQKVVIDGDAVSFMKPLVIYIRDCFISQCNIVFIPTWINGWPTIFIVSCKNIRKNEELLGHYFNQTIL